MTMSNAQVVGSEPQQTGSDMYGFVSDHESGARTYANTIDRVLERGLLSRVFDTEGREYLDCLACAGTLATGHNHPYIVRQVQEFLRSGHILQALDITTPAKFRFLRALLQCLPEEFSQRARVQFCGPSGADAVEASIKLFKTATGRRTVVAFHGAYHGMTAGALALTGNLTAKLRVASLMPDAHFLPFPYRYRCPFGLGGEQTDAVSLAYIGRVLADPESGISLPAAVIVEAVQGEGGVIPASREWLRGLRKITRELNIPLIIDEIQTGFGRTGSMFAFEWAGIAPDAILVSKAIGGGFPMSLLIYDKKYDVWDRGAHAGTFRGNQIAMIAGVATLEVLHKENLVHGAREKGEYLGEQLRHMAERHSAIGDVRGRGLMWGIELVDRKSAPDIIGAFPSFGALAVSVKRRCLENGLIVETGGRNGAVVRLLPPLVISMKEIDELIAKLDLSISESLRTVGAAT